MILLPGPGEGILAISVLPCGLFIASFLTSSNKSTLPVRALAVFNPNNTPELVINPAPPIKASLVNPGRPTVPLTIADAAVPPAPAAPKPSIA